MEVVTRIDGRAAFLDMFTLATFILVYFSVDSGFPLTYFLALNLLRFANF